MIWCLFWRLRNLKDGYHELNRRAKVESEMWHYVKNGTTADATKIREWAIRLGVPNEFQQK